ncbi:MAG TPA: hypothetical protein PLG20_10010, partial [Candidatus Syntrophosphaera sp.]|nr:hypothetical protein [Candidatus Syntrophosphaera sp.]
VSIKFPGLPEGKPAYLGRLKACPVFTHLYALYLGILPEAMAETQQEEGPRSRFQNQFRKATHYEELPKYHSNRIVTIRITCM